MNTIRISDASGSLVYTVSIADLEKWATLSEFFRGMLSFGVESTITLPFPKQYVEGAITYLNTPTVENYIATKEDIREFLGLEPSDRYEWLQNSYTTISEFMKQTNNIFIWDTTPDINEVIDNFLLIVDLYKFDTIYYIYNLNEHIIKTLESKSKVQVKHWMNWFPPTEKTILFCKSPQNNLGTSQWEAIPKCYFYGTLWEYKDSWTDEHNTPDKLTIGNTRFVDIDIKQSLNYPKDTIDPIYKLMHTEKARTYLGNKADITDLVRHVPQINSFGLYPPRFKVIDIGKDFDLTTIINPDAVVIFMNSPMENAHYIYGTDISDILDGHTTATDVNEYPWFEPYCMKVRSPFELDQKVPIDVPVIVVGRKSKYKYEVSYRSLNQVTYYHIK